MRRYFLLLLALCTVTVIKTQDTITIQDLQHASRIFGIHFTPAELDSLHDGVLDQLRDYQRNRELTLDNSVAPALQFNPHPHGFVMPRGDSHMTFKQRQRARPDTLDQLAFYSVSDLAYLIKTRQVTSVELTRFFLDRLRQHDPTLHCVITYMEERALQQAEQMDRELADGKYRGFLHGIPYGITDLFAAKG
ncbi:MAG: amidase family protein [Saprospiraceae bacterium]|nr:amidase family protein [Saprospiraceae bacterium]